jgi:hypothetical protein
MVWDFVFRTRTTMRHLSGHTPAWRSLGFRGEWLKLRARWNWIWERHTVRGDLRRGGRFSQLTLAEREFLRLALSQASYESAGQFTWQIEAAACVAWALRLLPRLWPMDEQFDGKLDLPALGSPERQLVETAALRPFEEIQTARARVKLWHWRARSWQFEREKSAWPPKDASPEALADLQAKGLDTMDGLVRANARCLRDEGLLEETIDDDFVAKGKPYRRLTEKEAAELLRIASERHRALNWLCGLAPGNDWATVPTDT